MEILCDLRALRVLNVLPIFRSARRAPLNQSGPLRATGPTHEGLQSLFGMPTGKATKTGMRARSNGADRKLNSLKSPDFRHRGRGIGQG